MKIYLTGEIILKNTDSGEKILILAIQKNH